MLAERVASVGIAPGPRNRTHATERAGAVATPESLPARTTSSARISRLGQVVLGLIWLFDGLLQFQPYMFGKTFITDVILPNAQGQPGVIASPITWIAHLIEPHVVLFNAFAATLQVLIGLGLLHRRTVKPALVVSFAWVLGIWLTGEGLGGFFNGTASPLTGAPGAALLYLVAGLMVWPEGIIPRLGLRGQHLGLVGTRGGRVVLALLWGGFGLLWLLPRDSSAGAIHDAISNVPTGAGWLSSLLSQIAGATAGHGTEIALVLAVLCGMIAFAVVRQWHMRGFLWFSIVLALVFWIVGQGFGGVFTGQATDLNTGPLLMLLAGLLLAGSRSVDSHAARRSTEREARA